MHLIGKDILTTHAVYWSTMLMALGLDLPRTIFAHGWWTVDGEKMSKSRGNVVDPNKVMSDLNAAGAHADAAVDAFRYFLLREVPFGQDGDFSVRALKKRMDSDLANGIGNLLSRTLTMIDRNCSGAIPDVPKDYLDGEVANEKYPLLVHAKESLRTLGHELDRFFNDLEFNNLLLHITSRASDVDTFIEKHQPWKLAKDPGKRDELQAVLYTAAECLRILSLYIYPVMPDTAKNIANRSAPHRFVGDQHVLRVEEQDADFLHRRMRHCRPKIVLQRIPARSTGRPSNRVSSSRNAVASAIFSAATTPSLSPSRFSVSASAASSGPMPPNWAISALACAFVSRRGIASASRYSTSSWSSNAFGPPSKRRRRSRARCPDASPGVSPIQCDC